LQKYFPDTILEVMQMYPSILDKTFEDFPELLDLIEEKASSESNENSTKKYLNICENYKTILEDAKVQHNKDEEEKKNVLPVKLVKIAKLAAERAYFRNTYSILQPLIIELEKAVKIDNLDLKTEHISDIQSACYTLEQKKSDQEIFARRCKTKRNAYSNNAKVIGNVLVLFKTIIHQQKEEKEDEVQSTEQQMVKPTSQQTFLF